MKEIKMSHIQYSLIAVSFLSSDNTLSSQVVYHDINPDKVLNFMGDHLYLNVDETYESEFYFFQYSRNGFYNPYFFGRHREQIAVFGKFYLDKSAALLVGSLYLSGYGFTASSYSPLVLYFGDEIDSLNNFKRQPTIALHSSSSGGEIVRTAGNWYPEEKNKYMGFRLKTDCAQYGWIRCSVLDSGKYLILKDYAIETQCDLPILAGSTVSYVDIDETANTLDASVSSFQKSIYCIINHEDMNAELFIYSIRGEKILTQKLTSEKTAIDFSKYASGIYVVEIRNDDKKFVKKVLVE